MTRKGWNKYGAKKTNGFASGKEARRFQELSLLLLAGDIADLEIQPRFELIVHETKIGRYTPDFRYKDTQTGEVVVEEVKGFRTRDYILRAKLFKALYPQIKFIEL